MSIFQPEQVPIFAPCTVDSIEAHYQQLPTIVPLTPKRRCLYTPPQRDIVPIAIVGIVGIVAFLGFLAFLVFMKK